VKNCTQFKLDGVNIITRINILKCFTTVALLYKTKFFGTQMCPFKAKWKLTLQKLNN